MKKLGVLLLSLGMVATSLFGCTGNQASVSNETNEEANSSKKITIGVCQLVQHVALDSATQGFIDTVKAEFGDDVEIINQNASGDVANCATIVNSFVSRNVDLILANATSPLQAAASATKNIPVLGTSITDYATALELSNFDGVVGSNVSGTSDLSPLKEQAEMVKEWVPEAKTCGILFCSSEANSEYQVKEMTKYLTDMGIEVKEFSFTDSNDVAQVTQNACAKCDVIYIPTDNTAASNAEAIANVVVPAKKVVIAGEKGLCEACGVATLSIDYYDLGATTGKMAIDILKNGADVSSMKIEYAENPTKMYNAKMLEELGLEVIDGYDAI